MAAKIRKNFSRGVLAADLTVEALQLTMKAGHNLPIAAGNFPLVIWNFLASPDPADAIDLEIVLAEYSGTVNVYNITRAQEDTFALIHHIDDRVALHYTAGMSVDDMKHSNLTQLAYANAGHSGFEPTVIKGNLTAGSSKIIIGGTGTGALIGAGAHVDVDESELHHSNLDKLTYVNSGHTGFQKELVYDGVLGSYLIDN